MAIQLSEKIKNYLLAIIILGLAGETIWVNLQNIKLKESLAGIGNPFGAGLNRGDEAPSFELSSMEGEPFKLDNFRGVPITLVYFSPDCRGCEKEIPLWRCLYESKETNGGFMFGVSNSNPEVIRSYLSKNSLKFPVLLDTAGSFVGEYHITDLPRIIRIDENGRIIGL